ncbi:DUF4148 domain-containing protein [Caballeronia sp. GAFFF2]|uniref:DUF4148 domain-containing protein n=1 Tax=Caballeronia sp. GAFFF2 TaxID=2921741 RepID=UPI0020295735|nr:DUF4148 domain-containing protein [Caballeronia sp. GAFFF2]
MSKSLSIARRWPLIVATTCLMHAAPAFSQSTASPPTGQAAKASPTSTQPEASTTTSAHPQAPDKVARKARRGKKNAELGTLEKNGYNPAAGDNTYPDSLQNAEKKSNGK